MLEGVTLLHLCCCLVPFVVVRFVVRVRLVHCNTTLQYFSDVRVSGHRPPLGGVHLAQFFSWREK